MSDTPDFLAELGPLALTLRLKRLADKMQEDGRRLYKERDIPLEPHWFSLLMLLEKYEGLSVTQIAEHLRQSHPSVISNTKKMQYAGLLHASYDPKDGRRRMLRISPETREKLPEYENLWEAFQKEISDLLSNRSEPLFAALHALETQLAEKSLAERVHRRLDNPQAPSLATPSETLSEETTATISIDQPSSPSSSPVEPPRGPRKPRVLPQIRPINRRDRSNVLYIAQELIREGNTYMFDPKTDHETLWNYWAPTHPGKGNVAVHRGKIVGMYVLRPNQQGPGSHIANASYAVRAENRGSGVGRAMAESSIEIARRIGFRGMQFNAVISTNLAAIALWKSLGFQIVGTVPDGFQLPDGRYVDHHIMYKSLV